MKALVLQLGSRDFSIVFSAASLIVSLGVLIIYVLQYRQQKQQLQEQRRQIENQEKQLDAQRTELEQQERELEQYQQELKELERQTELAELEHQAHLEVEDYEFEADRIIVVLSNYGNGPATNLRLQTTLETNGPDHIQPEAATSRLRRRSRSEATSHEGQAIRPGEQRIEFESEAIVGLVGPTGESHQESLRGVLMDLRDADAPDTATVTFDLIAETLTQDERSIPVTDQPLPLSIPDGTGPVNLATAVVPGLRF